MTWPSMKMDLLLTSLVVLLFRSSFFSAVRSTEFTIVNECQSTIWPAIRTTAGGAPLTPAGFVLESKESKTLSVPKSWGGKVWGRTHCSTDTSTGNFSCLTGDCGSGKVECSGSSGTAAVTLAEFTLSVNDLDFYDLTLVNGFNLPMMVAPKGSKSGGCNSTNCLRDLNDGCPVELSVMRTNMTRNETVACKSPCAAFGTPMYCCTGEYSTKNKCQHPDYTLYFVRGCPQAYSYTYDDSSSIFTCASAGDYFIVFCPSANTSLISGPTLPPAPAPTPGPNKRSKNWIPGVVAAIIVLLTLLGLFWCRKRIGCLQDGCLVDLVVKSRMILVQCLRGRDEEDEDSPFFRYTTIEIATNYLSDENILGRGGYGPVYKGKLPNGKEIAVKRLQKMSGHGIEQFRNEVTVISKLQHRNLVRLLGYCTENNERILIYEYLPNKSLDSIIFDEERRTILGWKSRLQIIEGIAQGLLYLHKYSRLTIIHRDLKTSNILLDRDLNPKISDFGTAKIFGDDELSANTNRIVGTYGYMAPEYAMDGIFSMKSDVFSFGVMMLEIISGKKNTAFYNSDRHINLLGYVWDLWNEERVQEITDPSLIETISIGEVVRYVQVGLLCVQENAADRPTMSDVVSMLQKESISLPSPKQPSFTAILSVTNPNLCSTSEPAASLNMVTISDVTGR